MDKFSAVLGEERGFSGEDPRTEQVLLNMTTTTTLTFSASELRITLVALGYAMKTSPTDVHPVEFLIDTVAAVLDAPTELASCYEALEHDDRSFVFILDAVQARALLTAFGLLRSERPIRLPGGVPVPTNDEIRLIRAMHRKLADAGANALPARI